MKYQSRSRRTQAERRASVGDAPAARSAGWIPATAATRTETDGPARAGRRRPHGTPHRRPADPGPQRERPSDTPSGRLADLSGSALGDLSDEARTTGVRVTARLAPAPAAGDPAPLRQVALNLPANAVRHNHPGGTATITTGTHDGLACVEVADTGPVLEPARVPALFEPFHRGPERRSHGQGLGLAVVRAIARTHQGEVTAAARPGGGLTVRVTLPGRAAAVGAGDEAPDL
ncbi:sensor histidine kinase [Streptomyces sp. NPDC093089]|uniref:sensor histidine kinase n=1 Tax=Streptomyces sp. NPDC093089 TaxID=3366024 RepID=UPI00381A3AD9